MLKKKPLRKLRGWQGHYHEQDIKYGNNIYGVHLGWKYEKEYKIIVSLVLSLNKNQGFESDREDQQLIGASVQLTWLR